MKHILMVSTSYPASPSDWKGVFIQRLTDALARRRDIDLRVWCPPGELPGNVGQVASESDSRWLSDLMQAGGIAHLMRRGDLRGWFKPLELLPRLRRRLQAPALSWTPIPNLFPELNANGVVACHLCRIHWGAIDVDRNG